jgi:dihydrolipoamide dehydrogenase
MLARKDGIVKQLTSGIKGLFKKNKVTLLNGHGAFVGRKGSAGSEVWQLKVDDDLVEAKQVIVATGSKARHLPGVPVDNEIVCDNVGALDIDAVPKKLAVIGAGVIGLEMGSVWRRLGSEVTILEALPDFLSVTDVDVAKEAAKIFAKQGLKIITGIDIGDVKVSQKGVSIDYTDKERQRAKTRRRSPHRLDWPHSEHRWPGCRQGWLETHRSWPDRSRFALPDQSPRRLGGGRRRCWSDAGAQGDGRGRDGCRDHGRSGRALQFRDDPLGDLHQSGDRLGRQDRAAVEGRRRCLTRPARFPSPPMVVRSAWAIRAALSRCLPAPTTDRILGVHIIGANASELISEGVVAMEFGAARKTWRASATRTRRCRKWSTKPRWPATSGRCTSSAEVKEKKRGARAPRLFRDV